MLTFNISLQKLCCHKKFASRILLLLILLANLNLSQTCYIYLFGTKFVLQQKKFASTQFLIYLMRFLICGKKIAYIQICLFAALFVVTVACMQKIIVCCGHIYGAAWMVAAERSNLVLGYCGNTKTAVTTSFCSDSPALC